eukprot:scaffold198778_cov17-Prasinocladus_malaysianus.AAC.1
MRMPGIRAGYFSYSYRLCVTYRTYRYGTLSSRPRSRGAYHRRQQASQPHTSTSTRTRQGLELPKIVAAT